MTLKMKKNNEILGKIRGDIGKILHNISIAMYSDTNNIDIRCLSSIMESLNNAMSTANDNMGTYSSVEPVEELDHIDLLSDLD